MFRTLVIAILWETLTFFEIDYFIQISYLSSLTVFFLFQKLVATDRMQRLLGDGKKNRQSKEFVDYLPLNYDRKSICLLTCSYNLIFFKMMKWKYSVSHIINFYTHFNFLMCCYESEKWFYVRRNLALMWDNFRIFAILAHRKSLSNKKSRKHSLFVKKNTQLKILSNIKS